MNRFTEFFWPILEKPTAAESASEDTEEENNIAAARAERWAQKPELALEEARRLFDSEEEMLPGGDVLIQAARL